MYAHLLSLATVQASHKDARAAGRRFCRSYTKCTRQIESPPKPAGMLRFLGEDGDS